MSLLEPARRPTEARSRPTVLSLAFALTIGLAAGLGGCTSVQPLYGSLDGKPSPAAAEMRNVTFAIADSRLSQHIRNELIFGFYGGEGTPDKAIYRLSIRVNENNVPVGVQRLEDVPAAYLQQLNATYTLVEISTQKTILTGTSFANAAYDFSSQRYANVRAQRDAENRAATVIAGDIRTKVAAFFVSRSR